MIVHLFIILPKTFHKSEPLFIVVEGSRVPSKYARPSIRLYDSELPKVSLSACLLNFSPDPELRRGASGIVTSRGVAEERQERRRMC